MVAQVIGLDIGTTSTIAVLVELPDRIVALATRPTTLRSPQPGWAEEDPAEWWSNACAVLRELLAAAPDHPAAAILRRGEILAHDLESATSALTEEKNGDRGPQEKRLREGLAALRRLVEEVRSLARSADLRAPELPEEASGKSAAAGREHLEDV